MALFFRLCMSPVIPLRLSLPHDAIDRYHVFFTFWHVSTSSDKSKAFSFGHVALTSEHGVVIPDQQLRAVRVSCERKIFV
jgi:hypothetical protein